MARATSQALTFPNMHFIWCLIKLKSMRRAGVALICFRWERLQRGCNRSVRPGDRYRRLDLRRLLQALRCTSHTSSVTSFTGPVGSRLLKQEMRVAGQLADKPNRGQPNRGLVNSRTGQFADWSTRGLVMSRLLWSSRGLDNSRTSQPADWTIRGLVNSRTGQLAD